MSLTFGLPFQTTHFKHETARKGRVKPHVKGEGAIQCKLDVAEGVRVTVIGTEASQIFSSTSVSYCQDYSQI